MKIFRIILFFILVLFFMSLAGCSLYVRPCPPDLAAIQPKPAVRSTQAIVVTEEHFLFLTSTWIFALESINGQWHPSFPPMKAVIGRNGFAPDGEKREGDGKTPSGQFGLKTAFGYPPSAPTRMLYRQALEDDLWVDDPQSSDYNRWVKQSATNAKSYEKMKRDDDQYKYGLVIEYNTDPVIPGYGSAIFLHIWKKPGSPTAGCVAASEENILKILGWLKPDADPVIVLNPGRN